MLLTSYAPLGSPKWLEVNSKDIILDEPIVKQIAHKYNTTNAQILIKFQVVNIFVLPYWYIFCNMT